MTNSKTKELIELGRKLKNTREERGLSVAQVASDLNLLDAYIKGLESGDHSSIKSSVFVRGYIRTYGNYLKLDVNVLVTQYDADAKAKIDEVVDDQDIDSSVNAIYVLLGIIFVGLLAWALWPSSADEVEVSNSQDSSAQQTVFENFEKPSEPELIPEIDGTLAELPAASLTMDTPVSLTIDTPIIDDVSSSDVVVNELLLRFVDECWVEVRDKAGRLLLADLKNAGDEVTLVGEPPYKAVIGNAAAVEIFYAGKAIKVVGRGESNTAKLVIGE
ncbi:MAG: cytoskeleton protein RodZ [Pseudomonadales bacterium]|jgi:cytoskeleton protein RodZ